MRRRDLILGLLAVATIDGAQAQQSAKVYRMAYVHPVHPAAQLTEANGYYRGSQGTPSLGIYRGAESRD